ncbi:MAG: carboxylesterase family protein [Pseudomonadota bacterium]
MRTFAILIVALAAIAGAAWWFLMRDAPAQPSAPLSTPSGEIVGAVTEDAGIVSYNGIPFAQPPVGDLRWAPPQPASAWSGTLEALEFGAECAQNRDGFNMFIDRMADGLGITGPRRALINAAINGAEPPPESEDCLYLNVRTGNAGGEALQPVMVWIHGGGHQNGSGSADIYQTNALVKRGVVLVTINYRLGPFGYMAHPALSADSRQNASGNYGLLDQIAALEWVRENISAFGGDPDNVLIFGESAGAQSVTELMASPLANGLYHKAILQSGASVNNLRDLREDRPDLPSAESVGVAFMEGLVEAGADVEALRAVPAEALVARAGERPDLTGAFGPVVDGWVLPRAIGLAVRDADTPDIPILAGYNADEGTLLYPLIPTPTTWRSPFPEGFEARLDAVREVYGAADGNRLIELYGLDDEPNQAAAEMDMFGDDLFGVNMRFLAKANASAGRPVYMYHFTRIPPNENQTAGAFHAAEIPFVFDSHNAFFEAKGRDMELTEAIIGYWTNFAKTGDPNGADLPEWPAYTIENDAWLILDHDIETVTALRAEKLDIMERALLTRLEALEPDPAAPLDTEIEEGDLAEALQP